MLGSLCNRGWAKGSNLSLTGIHCACHIYFRILQNKNYHVYKFLCTRETLNLLTSCLALHCYWAMLYLSEKTFLLDHYHLPMTAFYFWIFDKSKTNSSTISNIFSSQKSLKELWLAYLSLAISLRAFGTTMDWTKLYPLFVLVTPSFGYAKYSEVVNFGARRKNGHQSQYFPET